jgi:hypothetical protein
VRKKQTKNGSGRPGFWAGENQIAEAQTLFLQLVEQAAGPDVLGREDTKTDHDRKPARAWRQDHDETYPEQGESEENS